MKNKKIVLNLTDMLLGLLALTLVINMRTIWTAMPSMSHFSDLNDLLLVTAAGAYILVCKKFNRTFLNGLYITLFVLAYLLLFYAMDEGKYGNFLRLIMRVCVICLLCFALTEKHKRTLFFKMETIIIVIATVSLAFWVAGSLLGVLQPNGVIYTTWSADGSEVPVNSYFGIYYENTRYLSASLRLIRNSAIFTEAPMSSFMFCLALMVELFKKEKSNTAVCALLIIAVVSTFSTTGYVVIIGALFFKYFLSRAGSNAAYLLRLAVVPVILIAAVLVMEYLLESKLETSSGSIRLDDFAAGYKAWMDHPLMGNGYNNTNSYTYYMSSYRQNNTGFSNSLMQILAFGGIYLLLPYLGALGWGIYRQITRRGWNELVFMGLFVFMFVFTAVPFQMLTLLFFLSLL